MDHQARSAVAKHRGVRPIIEELEPLLAGELEAASLGVDIKISVGSAELAVLVRVDDFHRRTGSESGPSNGTGLCVMIKAKGIARVAFGKGGSGNNRKLIGSRLSQSGTNKKKPHPDL